MIGKAHLLFDPVKKYFEPHPDPPRASKPDLVLVTHGHTDHSNDIKSYPGIRKIMHAATSEILRHRYKIIKNEFILKKLMEPGQLTDVYKPIRYKDLKIEAFNAGHTVGSVQFKITSNDGTFVFTGDANSSGTTVMQPAPILDADVLAIEATMGDPSMISPTRREAFQVIHDFMETAFNNGHGMVVFFGHAIGKGQEMTKIINSLNQNGEKKLFVERRTFAINEVYEKYLIPLGKYAMIKNMNGKNDNIAVFLDLNKLVHSKLTGAKQFHLENEPPSLIVSAFGHEYEKQFQQLKISSHDDWNGLNRYVGTSVDKQAGKVITFHGFTDVLSSHLRQRGYDAVDSHQEVFTS